MQLLNDSFEFYKTNFKNIINIATPILILISMFAYLDYFSSGLIKIFSALLIAVGSLVITLFFQPILYRAIQQKESNNIFDKNEFYDFQKRNILNYIILHLWAFFYTIKVNIKYIGIIVLSFILIAISTFYPNKLLIIVSFALMIATIIYSIYKNFAKFVLYQNIYFSKNISPKEAVLESVKLGSNKNNDIWKTVLSLFTFNMACLLAVVLLYALLIVTNNISVNEFMIYLSEGIYPNTTVKIVEFMISVLLYFILTPIGFVILAKSYNQIKE